MNHREILGVDSTAGAKEIKQAFRQAAKELHPDLSKSPEAAEAFARIKEAHDALIKEAEVPRESVTVQSSAARAAAATTSAASDDTQHIAYEEIEHIQELDEEVRKPKKRSIFRRRSEPEEVRRHRKKIKTNERRLRGLY